MSDLDHEIFEGNSEHKAIEVIFLDDIHPIKATDLSLFIYQFKVLYSLLYSTPEHLDVARKLSNIPERINSLIKRVMMIDDKNSVLKFIEQINFSAKSIRKSLISSKSVGWPDRSNLYFKDLKEDDIFIDKITKGSPLKIWFASVSTLLILAFIICGGKLKLDIVGGKIEVEMSSLGEGIENLKDVLYQKRQYGEKDD